MKLATYLAVVILFVIGTICANGRGLYKVGVTAPTIQRLVAPSCPPQAVHRGGTVVVWVVVEEDGRVSDARIAHPAGLGIDEAVIKAVRQWSFLPARKDGKPVAVRITFPVTIDGDSLEVTVDLGHLSTGDA